MGNITRYAAAVAVTATLALTLGGCGATASNTSNTSQSSSSAAMEVSDKANANVTADANANENADGQNAQDQQGEAQNQASGQSSTQTAEDIRATMDISEILYDDLNHGPKPAEYQKYIVMHDTEGSGSPESVLSYWEGNGNLVAAHFVVGTDGHVLQCGNLEWIMHHAGYGDTGHNQLFGISEDGRDDMVGTVPIGSWASDYGMNAWSIGIEMVHVGGEGDYPQAQLEAVDKVIAYIDAYFGFQSEITDHNDWRSGNSDTSPEFATYLENLKETRSCFG